MKMPTIFKLIIILTIIGTIEILSSDTQELSAQSSPPCDNQCRMRREHYFCPDIPPPTDTPCIRFHLPCCNLCMPGLSHRCVPDGSSKNNCKKALLGETKVLVRYFNSCKTTCSCENGISVIEATEPLIEDVTKATIIDRYICE